jgi:CheY-like chemotaxis protein
MATGVIWRDSPDRAPLSTTALDSVIAGQACVTILAKVANRTGVTRTRPVQTLFGIEQSAAIPRGSLIIDILGDEPVSTILVVEDDESLRYAIAKQVEAAGYESIAVNSTMAALNVLDSPRKIDLLLTDIVMPKGQPNGLTLGRMARMKRLNLKVMLITGYDDLRINDETLSAKIFKKPLDYDVLLAAIGTQLAAS